MQLEVDAMQAEAANARAAAQANHSAVTEVDRLSQDNALLAARLAQMDIDIQVDSPNKIRLGSPGLFDLREDVSPWQSCSSACWQHLPLHMHPAVSSTLSTFSILRQ